MDYKTWKDNYEAEFEAHRKQNYRLIYRYQSEYQKYVDDPDWIQVGDFCNFHRVGTLHIGEEITAKYEKLLIENDDVLKGFCLDEFERIHVYSATLHDETYFDEAKKIFKYDNMSVRYETLSETQQLIFIVALGEHLEAHREDIQLLEKIREREEKLGL